MNENNGFKLKSLRDCEGLVSFIKELPPVINTGWEFYNETGEAIELEYRKDTGWFVCNGKGEVKIDDPVRWIFFNRKYINVGDAGVR